MNQDKLFVDVIQGMDDLIVLLEKAISVEQKMHKNYEKLSMNTLNKSLEVVLYRKSMQVYDTFKKLEGAIND